LSPDFRGARFKSFPKDILRRASIHMTEISVADDGGVVVLARNAKEPNTSWFYELSKGAQGWYVDVSGEGQVAIEPWQLR